MASDSLQRQALARAAARQAGVLPPLALFCDDERLPEPLKAAEALPRGSLVVVRSRDPGRLAALAEAMDEIARRRALNLLIAGDGTLARARHCGLHLPEIRAGEIARWRALCPAMPITAATHSLAALARAAYFGADAAFLSPVFATKSHPGAPAFGAARASLIARQVPLAVYALGGVTAQTARRLSGFSGIAAIGALA